VGSRPPDEGTLVALAKRGDAAAYEELVRMHQGIAFRVAYVAAGERGDAEEAVQDGFVKAYRALGRFCDGAPFRPWLLRIVANEARNRRRSAGRRTHLARPVAGLDAAPPTAPGPEDVLLAGEERDELVSALRHLDPPQRSVVLLRYVLELSEAECAAVLGCRPGTVKSRASRALARLRVELEGADA